MGDEVTKKDLQALQANGNKQFADLKKKIADLEGKFNKGLDDENAITVTASAGHTKRINELESRIPQLQDAINTLARAISEIAKKTGK